MTEETKAPAEAIAAPAAAPKAKPPAIEDKPLPQFAQEHLLPAVTTALEKEQIDGVKLSFESAPILMNASSSCSQLIGRFSNGHQFNIYFLDESVSGRKAFSSSAGGQASTLESFMIDERKATLDILVLYILQRLNSQKWLSKN